MKTEIGILILIFFSIGCNNKTQTAIFQSTTFVNAKAPKVYYFQIEPIKEENEIIEAKLVNEWKNEDGLFKLIDEISNEKKPIPIENYKYKANSETIVMIKKISNEFKIGDQFIIEIIQDSDFEYKINSAKTINLRTVFEVPIIEKKEANFLTSNGRIINCEYQYEGKLNCKKEDFILLIKNSDYSKDEIANKMKSILRSKIGKLLEKEVVEKIENYSLEKEIKANSEIECFSLDKFVLKIK